MSEWSNWLLITVYFPHMCFWHDLLQFHQLHLGFTGSIYRAQQKQPETPNNKVMMQPLPQLNCWICMDLHIWQYLKPTAGLWASSYSIWVTRPSANWSYATAGSECYRCWEASRVNGSLVGVAALWGRPSAELSLQRGNDPWIILNWPLFDSVRRTVWRTNDLTWFNWFIYVYLRF